MALEATFRELTTGLHQVNDAVNSLHVTIEDKPAHDEAAVADDLADKTLELLGFIHEARSAAAKARQALKHPADMDQARRALSQCQERFHRIEQKYAINLVSYEKLKELARVAGRSREWAAWAGGTKEGIEQCRDPLGTTSKRLAACWQEFAERLGMMNISVRATGFVQKLADEGQSRDDEETVHIGIP